MPCWLRQQASRKRTAATNALVGSASCAAGSEGARCSTGRCAWMKANISAKGGWAGSGKLPGDAANLLGCRPSRAASDTGSRGSAAASMQMKRAGTWSKGKSLMAHCEREARHQRAQHARVAPCLRRPPTPRRNPAPAMPPCARAPLAPPLHSAAAPAPRPRSRLCNPGMRCSAR